MPAATIQWEGRAFVLRSGIYRASVIYPPCFGVEPLLTTTAADDYYAEARRCWKERDAGERTFWVPRFCCVAEDFAQWFAESCYDVREYRSACDEQYGRSPLQGVYDVAKVWDSFLREWESLTRAVFGFRIFEPVGSCGI